MSRNILGIYSSSVSNAFFTFLTTVILSRFFGADGLADIGIFLFYATTVLIFSAVLGSSAIVYVLPRHQFKSVFYIANIGAIILPLLFAIIFRFFEPEYPYLFWLVAISIIQSIYINLLSISLAKKWLTNYNLVRILQPILLAAGVLACSIVKPNFAINFYLTALAFSYIVPIFVLIFGQIKLLAASRLDSLDIKLTARTFLKFGGLSQLTNLVQLLNYRIAYLFLAMFCTKSEVGVMVLAMTLVDGIWIFKNSISLLTYVDASNQIDNGLMKKHMTLSFAVTLLLLLIAVIIPNEIYSFVFGGDFGKLKTALLLMSPGILIMSVSSILANYFSGRGKVQINLFVALISLIAFLPSIYLLSKTNGLFGAAVANNIPHVIGSLILFCLYWNPFKTGHVNFIPRNDRTYK